ncbi:unnamed protein product [Timema podura]|uniref:RING-type domain-containing protein n=1 Tax=Timema podura TaxID=61482 RepID=A0ABN7NJR5_TIMPD|nr:unnamed protein product [Timema podura]
MSKFEFSESVPTFVSRESRKPFRKNHSSTLDQDSNPSFPVLAIPVYRKSDTLDHVEFVDEQRTEAGKLGNTPQETREHHRYLARNQRPSLDKPYTGNNPRSSLDERAVLDIGPKTSVVQHLVDYNEARTLWEFEKTFYTCSICFSDKIGAQCTKFDKCHHVFCKECMTGYFEVRIKEGRVHSIKCPDEKCIQ